MREILYTIGYEKRSLQEFIAILRQHGVDALVDVRDVAWSHKPGFAKSALRAGLEAAGIEYVHAQFVGNPKQLRAKGGMGAEVAMMCFERDPAQCHRSVLAARWEKTGPRRFKRLGAA